MIYACPYCEGEMLRREPEAVSQVCMFCRRQIAEQRIEAMKAGLLPINGEMPPLAPLEIA